MNMYNTYKTSKTVVKTVPPSGKFPNKQTRFQKQFYESLLYLSKNVSADGIKFFYSKRKWGDLSKYSDDELSDLYEVVSYYTEPQGNMPPMVFTDSEFGRAMHAFANKIREEKVYRNRINTRESNSHNDNSISSSAKDNNKYATVEKKKDVQRKNETGEDMYFDLSFSSFSDARFPDTSSDLFSDMLKETV